jgi:hypothetical protein
VRLSVITLGHVHAEDITALTAHCTHIEQLVLDIDPRAPLSSHRAEFNRAVDAATADWTLIIREREVVGEQLAKEIADSAAAAKAWGFRIRSVPYYAGAPLRLLQNGGEVRLFHKRHYLRFANKGEWDEVSVQGTVVRLNGELRSVTFESVQAHEQELARSGVRRSLLRRLAVFTGYLLGARTSDANTLRYLWVEAGWSQKR